MKALIIKFYNVLTMQYDPSGALAPPTGELKEQPKRKGGSNSLTPEMHIDPNTGKTSIKNEIEGAEAGSWTIGRQKKKEKAITVPAMTQDEADYIIEAGLSLDKYKELRPHFFTGLSAEKISNSYTQQGFDGYKRSTVFSYQKCFRAIWVQNSPE